MHTAIQHAVGLRGVAVVTLPGDIAGLEATAANRRLPAAFRPATLTPDPASVAGAGRRHQRGRQGDDLRRRRRRGRPRRGHGPRRAIKAPVGHALRGKEFIQYDNPYDVGMTGLLGYGAASEAIEDADLLILLGTDFPYDQFLPRDPHGAGRPGRAAAWADAPTSTSPCTATSAHARSLMPLVEAEEEPPLPRPRC